jgi:vacuolar-type H+-ATPase subunit F/Vma7
MSRVLFAGDEVSAAGFRLAGAECLPDDPQEVLSRITADDEDCDLVLMTAEFADRLPEAVRDRLSAQIRPLVVLLPDIRGAVAPPDLEVAVRAALGIEG